MKTLKKTLCLVLAVVMAVGVLILPANAAGYDDFTDTDMIKDDFKVAVETLTGMGIISGTSSTTFTPGDTLRRQQAAVMIVNVMMTATEKATALAGYSDRFTDITGADTYARKEINYLAAKGIVSGKADDKFVPNGTLTTYELLTMLRKVAQILNGYVPGEGEWTAEAMRFAVAYGVFTDGLERLFENPNETPTREEAAQIIWNAINAKGDTSATGTYTVTVTEKNTEGTVVGTNTYPGVSLEQAMMLKLTYNDAKYTVNVKPDGVGGKSIASTVYHLGLVPVSDKFGAITDTYMNTVSKKVFSAYPRASVYTGHDQLDSEDLMKALGYDFKQDTILVSYTEDGNDNYFTGYARKVDGYAVVDKDVPSDYHYGVDGATIDIYPAGVTVVGDEYVDMYDIVVRNNYIAVAGKPDKDGKLDFGNITLANNTVVDTKLIDAGSVKEGDVVCFNVSDEDDKVYNLTALTPVAGYVDAVSSNRTDPFFRVNGDKRYYAAKALIGANTTSDIIKDAKTLTPSKSVVYDVYLDNAGYVLCVKTPTVASSTAPLNYIYVLDADWVVGNDASTGTGLFPSAPTPYKDSQAKARVLDLTTGAVRDVDLKIISETLSGVTSWYIATAAGKGTKIVSDEKDVVYANTARGKWAAELKGYASYVEEDGKYILTPVTNTATVVETSSATLTAASPAITGVNSNPVYANSSTKLIQLNTVVTTAGTSYTAPTETTGYTTYTARKLDNALILLDTNGVVKTIYNIKAADTPEANVIKNAIYLGQGEINTEGFGYLFLVDGSVQTIYSAQENNTLKTAESANKVYDVTIENGLINSVSAANATQSGQLTNVQNEYIVVKDSSDHVINLATSYVIYDTTTNTDGTVKGVATSWPDWAKKNVTVDVYTTGTGSSTKAVVILIKTVA